MGAGRVPEGWVATMSDVGAVRSVSSSIDKVMKETKIPHEDSTKKYIRRTHVCAVVLGL